jgi:cytochrome c553
MFWPVHTNWTGHFTGHLPHQHRLIQRGTSAMKRYGVVVGFILFCGIGTAHAQDAGSKSTSAGVFTEEQAKDGAIAYNANCATCHGPQLRSGDREIPPLTDRAFQYTWVGKTIAEKFEVTRDTMPPGAVRSLDDQVYLDIVAYILRFNKIPAGNQRLVPDLQMLKQIVISAPPG